MAVIKVAKVGGSLAGAMNYVDKKAELKSGKDCSDSKEEALKEMQTTKGMFEKEDGRQYKHYIQSFSPNETTSEKAHEIGKEWAERNFKGHEVFIATHTDKNHTHNHFIVNTVNFENGKKFHEMKKDLAERKKDNDRICEREKLSVPERKNDKEFRSFDQNKYQLFQRIEKGDNVKSYVLEAGKAVMKAKETASSKDEFIKNMTKQGYEVSWEENHKNVTFKDQDGNKVRLANLEKTFKDNNFSKEGLENGFSKLSERIREKQSERTTTDKQSNPDRTAVARDKTGDFNLFFGNNINKGSTNNIDRSSDENHSGEQGRQGNSDGRQKYDQRVTRNKQQDSSIMERNSKFEHGSNTKNTERGAGRTNSSITESIEHSDTDRRRIKEPYIQHQDGITENQGRSKAGSKENIRTHNENSFNNNSINTSTNTNSKFMDNTEESKGSQHQTNTNSNSKTKSNSESATDKTTAAAKEINNSILETAKEGLKSIESMIPIPEPVKIIAKAITKTISKEIDRER